MQKYYRSLWKYDIAGGPQLNLIQFVSNKKNWQNRLICLAECASCALWRLPKLALQQNSLELTLITHWQFCQFIPTFYDTVFQSKVLSNNKKIPPFACQRDHTITTCKLQVWQGIRHIKTKSKITVRQLLSQPLPQRPAHHRYNLKLFWTPVADKSQ